MAITRPRGGSDHGRFLPLASLAAFLFLLLAMFNAAPTRATTTVTWASNSSGDWSIPGNWSPAVDPDTSAYDVVLPDVDTLGPGSREVTLDQAGVDVNSVLIQEYPYNPPPGPLVSSPGDEPWDNILTLDQNPMVDTNLTLSGSRATLNLNGMTINTPTINVDAPVDEGGYWYRNRITGSAGTNDGLNAVMPSGTALTGYEGGFTAPNVFTPSSLATGGFTNPDGLTGSATSGTINAALNNSGLVWLTGASTLNGAVTNSGNFGYFRYDSSSGSTVNFSSTITNTDPNDVVDINGNSNITGAVVNENGAYFYTRGATSFSSTLTNESGGQFLFQPTGSNPGKFFINQGITNEGTGNIGTPTGMSSPLLTLTPVSSYMDFDGDLTMGSTVTSNVNLVNQNSGVLVMQGNTRIGQVDQLPLGSKPDVISSLENYSGGIATFQPTSPSSQDMEITGQIINDGTSAPAGDATTLNLLGHTIVRGRTLASPIVTNTNGAVLNYNAQVQVGYDVQADGDVTYQPQGNLDNNNGIINGYGSGNIIFYGGDQSNGDASHLLSTINLYDTAQFTTGRQGSSTFTNWGSVNGVSGTPTFNSGIFDNEGTISVSNGALFTLTSSTAGAAAAVNNYGNIAFTTAGTIDTVGGLINYHILTYSGGISEGGILTNDLNGTINATGGSINNVSFNNDAGGIMNLGTGAAGSLAITSGSLTQAGVINIAANFTLVSTPAFTNSGSIFLNGLNSDITSPGQTILNDGAISGVGLLGVGNTFGAVSNQVINGAGTGGITVGAGGMSIGGTLAPRNDGSISISSGAGLGIIGGSSGDTFTNSATGKITVGDAAAGILTDAGTNKILQNDGTLVGHGTVTFTGGINNGGTIEATATGLTLNGTVANADGSLIGTINVDAGSNLAITSNFSNVGAINLDGAGSALTDGNTNSTFLNQGVHANLTVNGTTTNLDFGGGMTNSGQITINPNAGLTLQNPAGGALLPLTNNDSISLIGKSSFKGGAINNTTGFVTATGPNESINTTSWNNTNGSLIVAGAGSTFTTNGGIFTNDGATLVLAGGDVATVGITTNNSANGAIGTMLINSGAMLTTTGFTNGGSITLAGSSVLNTAGFTNNAGTIVAGATSLLNTASLTQNGGTISIGGGSAANTNNYSLSGGFLDLNGNSAVVGKAFTFNSLVFTNTLGTVSMLNGATANVTQLVNGGDMTVDSASMFTSGGVGGDSNLGSVISVNGGSTLNLGVLNNTGGTLDAAGSTVAIGALTNNNNGNLTGTVLADSASTVTTGAITSAGSITVEGASTLTATNGGGALTTSGTVTVSGNKSFLNVGTVTQNGGTVAINGGGAMWTAGYTNNGGQLSGNGMSTVVGRAATIDTTAFNNVAGTVSLLNIATLDVTTITNTGSITADSESIVKTSPAGGAVNNENGVINIEGQSTLTVGNFDNDGGGLYVVGISDGTIGTLTNNNTGNATGTVTVDDASSLGTGVINSAGNITVEGGSFLSSGIADFNNNGVAVVQGDGSTLSVGDLNNNFGASLKMNGTSQVFAQTLTNTGDVNIDPGGVLTTQGTGNDSNVGTIEVSGAGSILQTDAMAPFANFTNTGGHLEVTEGGVTNFATLFNGDGTSTVYISDPNSKVNVSSIFNQGLITIDNTANLTSAGVGGDINTGGTIDVGGGSTFTLGNLNNTGGSLILVGGSTGTIGNLRNNNQAGATGDVSLDGGSTLAAGTITSQGNITVQGGATLTAGLGLSALTTSGTITVSGAGSLLNVGTTSQTAGTTAVNGGGVFWTLDYTNAGGVTLNGPANVAGQMFTLRVTGTLTNTGQITAENGAKVNASVRFVNTGGVLGLDPGSTFTSAGNGGDENINGTINVTGGSTLTLGDLDNTGGLLALTGGSTADLDGITNDSNAETGTVLVDGTSLLKTNGADFDNGGTLTVSAASGLDLGLGGVFGDLNSTGGVITATGAGTDLKIDNIDLQTKAVMSVSQGADIISPAGGSNVTVSDSSLTLADGLTLAANKLAFSAATVSVQNGTTVNNNNDLDNTLGSTLNINNSTVSNDGDINNSGTSTITVNGSTLEGDSLANSGSVNLGTGGVLTLGTTLTNADGASFTANGPLGRVTAVTLNNSGIFNAGDGAAIAISGAFSNFVGAQATFNSGPNDTTVTAESLDTDGSVLIENGSTIVLDGGIGNLTVSGSFAVNNAPSSADVGVVAVNGGAVSVTGGAGMDTLDFTVNSGSLTLQDDSTVAGFANTLTVHGTLDNNGSMSMLEGSTAVVNALTNTGLIAIDPGSTLSSSGTADSNSGSMTVTGTSAFSTAGSFTNTGGTLSVSAGAAVRILGGGAVLINGAMGNHTGSVTADGDSTLIDIDTLSNYGSITVSNGALFRTDASGNDLNAGTISVTGATAEVTTQGGAFENSSGVMDIADSGQFRTGFFDNHNFSSVTITDPQSELLVSSFDNEAGSFITVANNATLGTAGALDQNDGTMTVTGDDATYSANGNFTNNGTLAIADEGVANVFAGGALFTNRGGVSVDNQSSKLDVDTLDNSGTITAGGQGTVQTDGSGNDTNDSGTINVDGANSLFTTSGGTIDNTGGVITAVFGGSVQVGTITDSQTILVSGGSTFSDSGSLTNSGSITVDDSTMSVNNNFTNNANALVSVTDGARLNLNLVGGGTLTNNGTFLVNGPGTKLSSNSGWDNRTPGVIEVANGENVDPPSLSTEGFINIDPLSSMTVESFLQDDPGSGTVVDGMLTAPVQLTSGTIGGGGVINGSVDAGGVVVPGGIADPADLYLTVNGNYTQEASGTLDIGIDSLSNYNYLVVGSGGVSTLYGGELYLDLAAAYDPQYGDLFTVLYSPAGVNVGSPLDLVQSVSYGDGYFETLYNPTNVQVEFVPEPTTGLIVLACGLGYSIRRPRRKAA